MIQKLVFKEPAIHPYDQADQSYKTSSLKLASFKGRQILIIEQFTKINPNRIIYRTLVPGYTLNLETDRFTCEPIDETDREDLKKLLSSWARGNIIIDVRLEDIIQD